MIGFLGARAIAGVEVVTPRRYARTLTVDGDRGVVIVTPGSGDFLVADLSEDRKRLEMILVDVCGKGTHAGPAALQFAGALGGLIGALPPRELFRAANSFLIRQRDDEAFATAVHLLVDLEEGGYQITSGGHPPALRWDLPSCEWVIDNARGTALGVLRAPELHVSKGRLLPGEALMFYTDGVVESRLEDLDEGVAWLQREATEAVADGFEGAARRILSEVDLDDDDRAVVILERVPVSAAPAAEQPTVETGRETRIA
jgi:serine phosphatase RsbU (regulator of sigma subunit)